MSSAPRRTCIGCRRVASPGELVRVTSRPDGSLALGRHQPGRGAWLCPSPGCFDLAVRRRAFGRALRTEPAGNELALVRGKLFV